MTKTATQKGVDVAEEVVVGNVERLNEIDRIAQSAREARDKELAENGHEVVDTSGEEEAEEQEETVNSEQEEEQEVEQEEVKQEETEPKPKMVKVKVDGVEKEVPESMVIDAGIRAVQKESAADSRLAEATRLLKEAQQTVKPAKEPLPDMDEVDLLNRVRSGTDEEAQEAARLLQGRNKTTPEEIATAVEARVLKGIEIKEAGQWFIETYPEIVDDPYLTNLAIAEENRLRAEGDERPFKEIFKDIGDGINKKLTEWRGGKTPVVTSTDKKAKKADIVNLNAASAKKVTPEQPKPQTTAEVIEEMRKARGQA